MKRKLSYLLLAGGVIITAVAILNIYQSSKKEEQTLERAIEHMDTGDLPQYSRTNKEIDRKDIKEDNVDILGVLQFPSIKEKLPIVKGISEDSLKHGVGHYDGTALPNENDQIVLSGHRDTVFKRLGELKVGDEIVVKMTYGTYTYVIEETFIVEADDRTVIRPTAPNEVLTITTCYPFNFVGDAPKRYIVNAKRNG